MKQRFGVSAACQQQQTLLPRLPAPRIAPAMEAGDCDNPMLLNLEEYSVETAALPHGDGSGRQQGIAMDALRLPQP
ncbi:MAG: hypothetical protein WB558_25360 [Terriglobales bacterium]